MGKRQLTQQQQRRIQAQQTQYQAKVDNLGPVENGLVIARYGKHIDIEDEQRGLHHCHLRQNLGQVAVGDRVLWQRGDPYNPVVVSVMPRHTSLARHHKFEGEKLVAANLDQLVIVVAPEPVRALNVLDRYLFLAELQHIPCIIVFNKMDLLTEKTVMELYLALGYPVIYTSTLSGEGLEILGKQLAHATSVFAGVSGVGKSSLIRHFCPEADIHVGELSEKTREGNHTTTTAQWYHLPGGGAVIDCPGIRELSFAPMTQKQVEAGFKEIRAYAEQCQFRDCSHREEPGCAVLAAIKTGQVFAQRWISYRNLVVPS